MKTDENCERCYSCGDAVEAHSYEDIENNVIVWKEGAYSTRAEMAGKPLCKPCYDTINNGLNILQLNIKKALKELNALYFEKVSKINA